MIDFFCLKVFSFRLSSETFRDIAMQAFEITAIGKFKHYPQREAFFLRYPVYFCVKLLRDIGFDGHGKGEN